MVPRERIELSASPLPRVRSTTELPRRLFKTRAYLCEARCCQDTLNAILNVGSNIAIGFHMSEDTGKKMSREERLAAKLRENLRRRKAQTREMKTESGDKELPNQGRES